jgi:hypothetical protein
LSSAASGYSKRKKREDKHPVPRQPTFRPRATPQADGTNRAFRLADLCGLIAWNDAPIPADTRARGVGALQDRRTQAGDATSSRPRVMLLNPRG